MPKMRNPETSKKTVEMQRILDSLLGCYELQNNGQTVRFVNPYMEDVYLIELALSTQKLFPDIAEVQRLGYLRKATISLKKRLQVEHTIPNLLAELDTYLDQKAACNIQVTVFLNLQYNESPDTIQFENLSFSKQEQYIYRKFIDHKEIQSDFPIFNDDDTDSLFSLLTPYTYDITLPKYKIAGGIFDSVREVIGPFEKLRSLLNFSHCVNRYDIHIFSVHPRPASTFVPTPFYFFEEDGKILKEFLFEPLTLSLNLSRVPRRASAWHRFSTIVTNLAKVSEKSFLEFLWDLLAIYQRALDTTEDSVSFLHYWQVLERIASPFQEERRSKTEDQIKRLSVLLRLNNSEQLVLKELSKHRNSFAHEGKYPLDSGKYYKRVLKMLADGALSFLLYEGFKKFQSKIHFDEYYNIATQSVDRLRALQDVLNIMAAEQDASEQDIVVEDESE